MPPKVNRPVDTYPHENNDSDSEEDELSSEFEENVDDPDYYPKGLLPLPRTANYSIESLYAMMHCNDIELEPEYQREPKQVHLIDSIFRNYYIPPVLFHVVTNKRGMEKRICIDGKQRLTSILRFIDGMIAYKDPSNGVKYWSDKSKDSLKAKQGRSRILPRNAMSHFYRKQLVCIEYYDLSPIQEREIFHRVQMGMPLSSAERMSAIATRRTAFARKLEKKLEDWPESIKMADDRKRRFQVIGHILRAVSTLPAKITVPSGVALERWLRDMDHVENEEDIENDFDIILTIGKEYTDVAFPSFLPAIFAPIEFIYATVIVHQYKQRLKTDQLAMAIQQMRRTVRSVHKDIRTNNNVSKTLENFVWTDMEQKLITGEFGAYEAPPQIAIGKRKRGSNEDRDYVDDTGMDMSEDYIRPVTTRKKRSSQARSTSSTTPSAGSFVQQSSTPSKTVPNDPMKMSPPFSSISLSGTPAPVTPSKPPGVGAASISGSVTMRGARGWGSGLHSLASAYRPGQG